jgi:hypothetical protein
MIASQPSAGRASRPTIEALNANGTLKARAIARSGRSRSTAASAKST